MRLRGRKDRTHDDIVEMLRAYGSVLSLANLGDGAPDLLFGCRACGRNHLVEAKDSHQPPSRRRLTPDEETFAATWQGEPVTVLDSGPEAEAWARSHLLHASAQNRSRVDKTP